MKRIARLALLSICAASLTGCKPDAAVSSGGVVDAGPQNPTPESNPEVRRNQDTPAVTQPAAPANAPQPGR